MSRSNVLSGWKPPPVATGAVIGAISPAVRSAACSKSRGVEEPRPPNRQNRLSRVRCPSREVPMDPRPVTLLVSSPQHDRREHGHFQNPSESSGRIRGLKTVHTCGFRFIPRPVFSGVHEGRGCIHVLIFCLPGRPLPRWLSRGGDVRTCVVILTFPSILGRWNVYSRAHVLSFVPNCLPKVYPVMVILKPFEKSL